MARKVQLFLLLLAGVFLATTRGQFRRVVSVKLIGRPYQIHYGRTAPLLCTVTTVGGHTQVEIEWESTASGVDVATASSEIKEDAYVLSSLPIQGEIDTRFCGTYSCAASLSETLRDTQTFGIVPRFEVPRNNFTVPSGGDLTLSCVAGGVAGVAIEATWTVLGGSSTSSELPQPVERMDQQGRFFSSITLSNITEEGQYMCQVGYDADYLSNGGCPMRTASTIFSVSVERSSVSPPVILPVFRTMTAITGEMAFLTCKVQSENISSVTFQWSSEAGEVTNLVESEPIDEHRLSNALEFPSVALSSGGNYTCTVTDQYGSDSAVFTLYIAPVASPAVVDTAVGLAVSLTCAVQSPSLVVHWEKIEAAMNFATFSERSPLGFNPVVFGTEGVYRCVYDVPNDGPLHSNNVTLSVSPEGSVEVLPAIATFTRPFSLSCSSQGGPGNTYQWQNNGSSLAGETASTLSFSSPFLPSDAGHYSCIVSNSAGSGTASAVVYNSVPVSLSLYPQNTVVNASANITLDCVARGNPEPSLTWLLLRSSPQGEVEPLNEASYTSPDPVFDDGVFIATSTLRLQAVQPSDTGTYYCTAANTIDLTVHNVSQNFSLSIQTVPVVLPLMEYRTVLLVGDALTISFSIEGYPPVAAKDIQWTFTPHRVRPPSPPSPSPPPPSSLPPSSHSSPSPSSPSSPTPPPPSSPSSSSPSPPASSPSPTSSSPSTFYPSPPSSSPSSPTVDPLPELGLLSADRLSLELVDAVFTLEGSYNLTATNPAGSGRGTAAVDVQSPPMLTITTPDRVVSERENFVLLCDIMVDPFPETQWVFNNTVLSDSPRHRLIVGQRVVPHGTHHFLKFELLVRSAGLGDGGEYSCRAQNEHGSETASVRVDIQVPLALVSSPVDEVRQAMGVVSLSCEVRSSSQPEVTWFKDNELYSSMATVSLGDDVTYKSVVTLGPLRVADGGRYFCEALAGGQVVYSLSALLTIQFPLRVFPENGMASVGEQVQFQCIPGLNSTVEWMFGNEILTGDGRYEVTEAGHLTLLNVSLSDAGEYVCTASNDFGAASVSVHVTVLGPLSVMPEGSSLQDEIVRRDVELGSATLTFLLGATEPPVALADIVWSWESEEEELLDEAFFLSHPRHSLSPDRLSLSITSLALSDAGTFTVSVSNALDTQSASIELRLSVEPRLLPGGGPIGELSRDEGDTLSLHCAAAGTPHPSITWLYNGALLDAALHSRVEIASSALLGGGGRGGGGGGHASGQLMEVWSELSIAGLEEGDSGQYVCRAQSVGRPDVLQPPILLQVNARLVDYCAAEPCQGRGSCENVRGGFLCKECRDTYTGPTCSEELLVERPAMIISHPSSVFSQLYQTVSLYCGASGVPTPAVSWFKDGSELPDQRLPQLEIRELDPLKRGLYHCQAENEVHVASSSSLEGGERVERHIDTSQEAVVNIEGIVQYWSVFSLTSTASRRRRREGEALTEIIQELGELLAGRELESDNSTIFSLTTHEELVNGDVVVLLTLLLGNAGSAHQEESKRELEALLTAVVEEFGFAVRFSRLQRFDGCPDDTTTIPSIPFLPHLTLSLDWREAAIGELVELPCPCANLSLSGVQALTATRRCGGDFLSGGKWEAPLQDACNFSVTAREICEVSNIDDSEMAVQVLNDITGQTDDITAVEVVLTSKLLGTYTAEVKQAENLTLSENFLRVVDNLLFVDTDQLQLSQENSNSLSRLLEAVDTVADGIPVNETQGESAVSLRNFAVSVKLVKPESFNGQTFLVTLGQNFSTTDREEAIDEASFFILPSNNTDAYNESLTASISLPQAVLDMSISRPPGLLPNDTRIRHSVFLNDGLFLRRAETRADGLAVGGVIVSASLLSRSTGGIPVGNLSPPIRLTFKRAKGLGDNVSSSDALCSFWEPLADAGFGNWAQDGCEAVSHTEETVVCECDHLTNFAILLDVSPDTNVTTPPEAAIALQTITLIGVVISIVTLIITICTYISAKKLRSSVAGKLVINLSVGFLGVYLSYILAFLAPPVEELCVFAGVAVHYFMLATFFIMAAEAINLYILLVVVLGFKIHHYMLKSMLIAWILPVVIIIPSVAPDYHNYLNEHINFCRPYNVPFYAGLLAPFVLVYLFNWVVFVIIIVSILRKSCKKGEVSSDKTKHREEHKKHLIIAISLSILFGLGWGFGLPATQAVSVVGLRIALQALFIIFTSFHGFFIFAMQCLRSQVARREWWKWYYIFTCRYKLYKAGVFGNGSLSRSSTQGMRKKSSTFSEFLRKSSDSSAPFPNNSMALRKVSDYRSSPHSSFKKKHSHDSPRPRRKMANCTPPHLSANNSRRQQQQQQQLEEEKPPPPSKETGNRYQSVLGQLKEDLSLRRIEEGVEGNGDIAAEVHEREKETKNGGAIVGEQLGKMPPLEEQVDCSKSNGVGLSNGIESVKTNGIEISSDNEAITDLQVSNVIVLDDGGEANRYGDGSGVQGTLLAVEEGTEAEEIVLVVGLSEDPENPVHYAV